MKALAIIGILIVSVSYQNSKQRTAFRNYQQSAVYARTASAVFPLIPFGARNAAHGDRKHGFYQKAKHYLRKVLRPEYLAGWLLVGVALAGILYTIRTLNTLERQTKATEVAADAAKVSADAAKLGQRATLLTDFPKHPPTGFTVGGHPSIQVEVTNIGPTVARHCRYDIWKELLPAPFVDFTDQKEIYSVPFPATIFPQAKSRTTITIVLDHALTEKDLFYIEGGQVMFCFRIHFDYEDAFGNKRWSEFGLEFNGQRIGLLPKYNDSD